MLTRTGKKKLDEFLQKLEISKNTGYLEYKLGKQEAKELYEDFVSLFSEINEKNFNIIKLQEEIIQLQKQLIELKENQVIQVVVDEGF